MIRAVGRAALGFGCGILVCALSAHFAAASLVLQHGDVYASYALAHELSLCALLLGDKNSAWLLAATYDRMLGAAGHDQRFGTQYRGISTVKLIEVDAFGINDTERTAMHCPTLAKALTREF